MNEERLRLLYRYLKAIETVQAPKVDALRIKITDAAVMSGRLESIDRQRFLNDLRVIEAELDTARMVIDALDDAGIECDG